MLLKQRLAAIKDRFPALIAEVRGEGLLIGLRMVTPNTQMIDALRAEKLLAVGAGDNVVRLLPPLIVSDEELADAAARLTRACESLSAQQTAPAKAEIKVGTAP